jgi:hypothetical protein
MTAFLYPPFLTRLPVVLAPINQSRLAVLLPAIQRAADRRATATQALGDSVVAPSITGQQHDPVVNASVGVFASPGARINFSRVRR